MNAGTRQIIDTVFKNAQSARQERHEAWPLLTIYQKWDNMMLMKPLRWLHGEVKTPPMSAAARKELGFLLRLLQEGESLDIPQSRLMPGIGAGCHELRVTDAGGEWRLVYALTGGAVVVLDVFKKTTRTTPQAILNQCARRLRDYHRRDAK